MRLMTILLMILLVVFPGVVLAQAPVNRGIQPIRLSNERGEQVELYRESHALVIGVSDYSAGWPRLQGVKKDIRDVCELLSLQGFDVERVEDPTFEGLKKAFDDFINRYGRDPENRLLIYFSGHGHTDQPSYGGEMGYIVPVDAANPNRDRNAFLDKSLDMQQIEVYARRIQSKHALFIFDCCFSGSIFSLSKAAPENIGYKTRQPVRQFITAGSADETVPDESIFCRELLVALRGEGDRNEDGYVTGSELGEFLQEKVINYTRESQHPQYGKIRDRNLDQGDFVFQISGVVLPQSPPPSPGGSSFSLEDLREKAADQEALKAQWADNLAQMRKGFTEVESLEKLDLLVGDKALAWQRFLDSYVQDNPFSSEDDAIRQQARKQLEYWRNNQPAPTLEKTPEEDLSLSPGESLSSLSLKAAAGDADAQYNLGQLYGKGEGVPRDNSEAAKWYRLAADQGHADAQYLLGLLYSSGIGVLQDDAEAAKWYRLAADQGHADAQYLLGLMYRNGEGVPQDYSEAVKWYRQAADQGDAKAQYNLGWMYNNGDGVPQDYSEAVKWYRLAADQGHASAQYNLGVMYDEGERVPLNYVEAVKWYRLAADQGDAGAQYNLGLMYGKGEGVPQNDAEAVNWYRLAANQGIVSAQYNLGVMYGNGQGVPQDDAEAVNWYRLAADQGHASAQYNLGVMYDEGERVPLNYVEAVKWYRLAADQGDAGAQYNLGKRYISGKGVPQHYAESEKWFRLAADQGNAEAQNSLGSMYYYGWGVKEDYVVAHMWMNLAASQGDAYAKKILVSLGEAMSQKQIFQAQELARNWKPKTK